MPTPEESTKVLPGLMDRLWEKMEQTFRGNVYVDKEKRLHIPHIASLEPLRGCSWVGRTVDGVFYLDQPPLTFPGGCVG